MVMEDANVMVMGDGDAKAAPARGAALSSFGAAAAAEAAEAAWKGKVFSHPYDLAPFVVLGDWR
ncbi:MAG: hypothetical protein LBQ12_00560 [Deltaproteobacteria bacterium]|jgi:hypothetical protein|nr:hypothetical protein [Deltaproteobacteria bacterium]